MKILRIFGIVAAVHLFAFVFIMANPGCSTKSKNATAGASGEPMAAAEAPRADASSPFSPMPVSQAQEGSAGISFDPNAIAGASRTSPTRPNSAAASSLQSEASEETAAAVPATVTVGKGDSLWSLAKKAGVPVSELAAANHLKTSAVLAVGTKLVVPGKTVAAPKSTVSKTTSAAAPIGAKSPAAEAAPAKPAGKAGTVVHIVKPGEMLGSIARKYGVKAADIAVANNITNPAMIPSGRELIIPMPKAKGSSGNGSSASSAKTPASNKAPATSSTSPASEPVAKTAVEQTPANPVRNTRPIMPVIGNPSETQDLDAGLAPSTNNSVPIIKIEDDNAPRM